MYKVYTSVHACTCCGPLRHQQSWRPVCSQGGIQSHSVSPWRKRLIQGYCSESKHDLRAQKTGGHMKEFQVGRWKFCVIRDGAVCLPHHPDIPDPSVWVAVVTTQASCQRRGNLFFAARSNCRRAVRTASFGSCFSPTFAHSICISLQLTVLHARNEVKQSKNLLLGERSPRRHHQAPREVAGAVVDHRVAVGVGCGVKMGGRVNESSTTFPKSRMRTLRWKSMRIRRRFNYLCEVFCSQPLPLGPQ